MTPERLAIEMGLDIPDFDRMGYYGADYGTMKPYHRVGSLLFLSGHVAQVGTQITHKGRLGADVTTEQGYQAARRTGLNVLGGIRQAVELLTHRLNSLHDAHHQAMECLGRMVYESQRAGRMPDGEAYIACVQRHATKD